MPAPASRPSEVTVYDRIHPDNPSEGSSALGRIRPPLNLRRVAMAIAVAMPLFALLALMVPWQQSAVGTGRVIAYAPQERQQPVEAPISGRIVEWFVQEGQQVQTGDPLVELRDNDPDRLRRLENQQEATLAEKRAVEEQLISYERKLDAAIAARERQLAELNEDIEGARRKRVGEASEAMTAELNLDRTRLMAEEGIVSQRTLELAEMTVQKAKAALQARDRTIAAKMEARSKKQAEADGKVESTRAELQTTQTKLAEVRRKLLDLETTIARQASQVVRAPRDGTVLRLHGGLGGGQIKSGERVATLVPDTTSRAVELWVDGNDMPFITTGAHARLVFEGWPALQFVGLHEASQGTFGGEIAFIDATDDGKGGFRVVIVPSDDAEWPDASLLRQGVRVKGFVLLGRVPLGYEIWRQINGFPPMPAVEKGETTALPTNKKPRTPPALK